MITKEPNTMISIFKDIFQREGIRGLYRGITPNFLKVRQLNIQYFFQNKSNLEIQNVSTLIKRIFLTKH